MISVCDTVGNIRPLRFRFEDEVHQLQTVHIAEIICSKSVCYVGMEALLYVCKAEIDGRERMFELRYTIKNHIWMLFRMIY